MKKLSTAILTMVLLSTLSGCINDKTPARAENTNTDSYKLEYGLSDIYITEFESIKLGHCIIVTYDVGMALQCAGKQAKPM